MNTVGDFDGDDFKDIIIGSPSTDNQSKVGIVFLIFGLTFILSSPGDIDLATSPNSIVKGFKVSILI